MIRIVALLLVATLAGCGGGTGGDGGPTVAAAGCTGGCAAATPTALTVAEVNRILSQAVQEAQARGAPGTIAVVDRSGNVLAVFRMTGAAATFTISSGRSPAVSPPSGLEGVNILLSQYAAISKAITAAYLSSEGNAFTTRTANQIIQENFNPGEMGSPSGPLFGTQFSSLSCSDVVTGPGPKPSPLGLAADPGGLPLYKNGIVVGGVGVLADGVYGLDLNINDVDQNLDELIAVAGARGFDAPVNRRADHITVDGRTLRYVDSEAIVSVPAAAPAVPGSGSFIAVAPYYPGGGALPGTAFSTPASGFTPESATPEFAGLNAYKLDNGAGGNRFPPIAGTDTVPLGGASLTRPEVTRILAEAMKIANRARAQIRQPLGLAAQVNITVVDTNGVILGLIRTPDAPIFGADVAVQKARTTLFFSETTAATSLNNIVLTQTAVPPLPTTPPVSTYVTNMQSLIPGALTNGVAYSSCAIGNLARPFLPDGINGNPPGSLSKPYVQWSPFTDGLQLDLVRDKVVTNLSGGALVTGCSSVSANGIQIFPGGVPIYRGNVLVGAIGVSGDGIDQDDMVAFLGLANGGAALGTGIANAPAGIRADTITVPGGQLRYVNCPIAPFLDTTATNVCNGI